VNIKLRHDSTEMLPHGEGYLPRDVPAEYEDVDLDQLTPRARTLAEAVAQSSLRTAVDIWMERDKPIRETEPDWQQWYTEEEANRPERRPWRGWSAYPSTSTMTPVEYLEQQAQKIPPHWHVLGDHPTTLVPSKEAGAADQYLTRDQVLAYLRDRGRPIAPSTWSSYTARDQAPGADRHVGRTPQWAVATIDAYLDGTWKV